MSGFKDIPSAESRDVVGVVLLGGKSTRMGRDKAALTVEGSTLAAIAERNLESSGVAHVVRSGPGGIPDDAPEMGPLGGISSVARRLKGAAAMLVVPVDMPGLAPSLLARLLAVGAPAAFQGHELPALLPLDERLEAALARALVGKRSVRELLDHLGAKRLPVSERDAAFFTNLNTPEDWEDFGGGE